MLQRFIPPANPDFEQHYPHVRTWWVELDEKQIPTREIGFNVDGRPVALAPFGRNYGFIVDTCDPWTDADDECQEAKKKFQTTWEELAESLEKSTR